MSKVVLDPPDSIDYQLVYRSERSGHYDVAPPAGLEFVFLRTPARALRHLTALRRLLGFAGAAKCLAKLAAGRRAFYGVLADGAFVSFGWCTVGKCRHYLIEPDAVVIGPIESVEGLRGRGVATAALKLAVNAMVGSGHRVFYIDTAKANRAAQRVFEKCEFGLPVALFFRGASLGSRVLSRG